MTLIHEQKSYRLYRHNYCPNAYTIKTPDGTRLDTYYGYHAGIAFDRFVGNPAGCWKSYL